jgi:hypothetical protein
MTAANLTSRAWPQQREIDGNPVDFALDRNYDLILKFYGFAVPAATDRIGSGYVPWEDRKILDKT